jgi:hypothetical protein
MRIHLLASLALPLALIGCSTPLPEGAEKPPEHARRVQVAIYDSTSRPKTTHLDVYDTQLPQRPYKEIALLTCEGEPQEEAAMTTAILYRARMLGADAVMSAGTAVTQKGGGFIVTPRGGFSGGVDTRCVFRAKAIVYEEK